MKYVVITRSRDGRICGRNIIDLSAASSASLGDFAAFMNKELARSQSSRQPKTSTFTPIAEAEQLKIVTPDMKVHDKVWKLFRAIGYCEHNEEYT